MMMPYMSFTCHCCSNYDITEIFPSLSHIELAFVLSTCFATDGTAGIIKLSGSFRD